MRSRSLSLPLVTILVAVTAFFAGAAVAAAQDEDPNVVVDPALFDDLQYRSLNFTRGGRSTAVTGVADDPLTYYFGATGGGVWKTSDAGLTWDNVSDDGPFGVGSIGAIEVAPSDSNVVYVGTGEGCPRGNVTIGDGIYKSTDAGKSWKKVLPLTANIGKMVVHPKNPDIAYAAVIGNIFGANEDRGIYRTTDGGDSWDKVLYIDADTGFVDIEVDPNNPRVMLASAWTAERKPWTIISGSEDDGVYRTTDGGDSWEKLGGGLPTGLVGRSSVAISPADGERMWVLIEAPEDRGGVFRSDDGGDSWRRVNDDRKLLQRAWYYIHIYADPNDEDTVYALNTGFYKSVDGGESFDTTIRVPHGDNHDLWINPNDSKVMVNANDGGANVSFNGGDSWSHQRNQPTAQMYRVSVDEAWPYRVYGAQQDNSTARVSSQGGGFGFGGGFGADFESVGGGESGHIAIDPRNNEIVYAGSYGGTITRRNMETGVTQSVRAYPEAVTGQQAADMVYRFQWNAPIRISPHDPDIVYHTSQVVHRTTDNGRSWEVISPDLSSDDPETQGYAGGPITRDNTGVEVYNTIFAFEESPHTAGLLWAGTDDGRVWISRNAGGDWNEITPDGMPDGGTVNVIDLSAHDPGRAHIAVYRYRQDDFRPYVFQTSDYGASWSLLTDANGIPADHWVRTVREDPDRRGLLYAGTEFGMYISFDDGAHWQSFQLNLPQVPITEMLVHRDDLVVATQGRAFWILDNLTPLHQIQADAVGSEAILFAPKTAYRDFGGPAEIDFYVGEEPENAKIEILTADGEVVRTYEKGGGRDISSLLPPGMSLEDIPARFRDRIAAARGGLQVEAGHNRVSWDGAWEPIFERPEGIVMWGGGGAQGPPAVPGDYTVRLTVGDSVQEQTLTLEGDPRREITILEYEEELELAREVGARLDLLWTALEDLRSVKQRMQALGSMIQDQEGAREAMQLARQVRERLTEIEGDITQLEGEAGQDALNFPGRLDNQWATLYSSIAAPVTEGAHERFADLLPELQVVMDRLEEVYSGPLTELNEKVSAMEITLVPVPELPEREG